MVLAHNEEEKIVPCLGSIFACEPEVQPDVYVMANGCTDRTEELVKQFAKLQPTVHLVSIPLGDKNNAWNVFVHETAARDCPDCDVYFFMDGDARVAPGSFGAMARALEVDMHAHAASAVPGSGRSMRKDRDEILKRRGLVANLYALRRPFVKALQERNVRLPLKLEGDDGLLGALIKWDLDPKGKAWDDSRIHPCAEAAFLFDPVPVNRLDEWPKYWRRLVRYGRRAFEFQILGPLLSANGLAAMPRDIQELYPRAEQLRFQWRGIHTLPFAVALMQMRRIGRQLQEARAI
jgi:glycosyltransferase involved in cell wall biosynthesis